MLPSCVRRTDADPLDQLAGAKPLVAPSDDAWSRAEKRALAALESDPRVEQRAAANGDLVHLRLTGTPAGTAKIMVKGGRCYAVALAWPSAADGVSFSIGPIDEGVNRIGISVQTKEPGTLAQTFCADGDGEVSLTSTSLRQIDLGDGTPRLTARGDRSDVAVVLAPFPEPQEACEQRHAKEDELMRTDSERSRNVDRGRIASRCNTTCVSDGPGGLQAWLECKEAKKACERDAREMAAAIPDAPPPTPAPPCRADNGDTDDLRAQRDVR